MSEPKYVAPGPLTPGQITELNKVAAAAGAVTTPEWDLQRQLDITREQWRRHRNRFMSQQERHHGDMIRAELEGLGGPAVGEALMHASAILAGLVLQGATAQNVINVLAFAGYGLHQGEMP